MKRIAFPMVVMAILAAGVMFGTASKAARSGVSEEALLRSGHTIDRQCGAPTISDATAGGEPVQLAAAIKCEEFSDGSCVAPGSICGSAGSKKKKNSNLGLCTTVIDQHKRVSCACVK